MRYYVEQQADGWYAVNQYAPEGWDWVGPYATQRAAEDAAYQWQTTGTKPSIAPTGGGAVPTGGGDVPSVYASTTGGAVTPRGDGTYNTVNGVRTLQQMEQELYAAGWGGAGGGGTEGYATLPAQLPYLIQQEIARLTYQLGQAQLAFDQRRFEEYDKIMLQIRQAESDLARRLDTAGVTGYLEGQPTFQREQWAGQQAQNVAALTGWYTPPTQPGYQLGVGETITPMASPEDMANIRSQLQVAGWGGGTDAEAVQTFLSLAGNDPTQQGLVARLRGQVPAMGQPVGYQPFMGAGTVPTIEMARLMGEPRNLAQTLTLLGYTPEQTAQWLGQTPAVQNLMGYPGVSFAGGVTPEGRNPLFPFITGRQLPVRSTLEAIQTQSPMIPLLEGLFSYSGQDPNFAFGEFESFLPRGSRNPLTAYLS